MSRKKNAGVSTTRKTFGQVLVCLGCCCGRTGKGHPEVPAEWLKDQWRKHMLLKKVHLIISGCLGPCDASNIVLVMMGGRPVWLGGLETREHYQALVDWGCACDAAGHVVPLPEVLAPHRMERFASQHHYTPDFEDSACCPAEEVA